jgi:hypothetical protein
VYVFNWWDTQGNTTPAANVNDRTDFLIRLSKEHDPRAFAVAVLHNVYDRVDLVALRRDPGAGLDYTFTDDAFPRGPVQRTLVYADALFGTPTFRRVDTTSFTLFRVSHQRDPLRALRSCPGDPTPDACRVLGALARRYPGHLDRAVLDLAARWRAALARVGSGGP